MKKVDKEEKTQKMMEEELKSMETKLNLSQKRKAVSAKSLSFNLDSNFILLGLFYN